MAEKRACANLGCGRRVRYSTTREAWLNVDLLPESHLRRLIEKDGDAERLVELAYMQADLFAYPWLFADESFDHVLLRHVAEHIPHQTRMRIIPPSLGLAPENYTPEQWLPFRVTAEGLPYLDVLAQLDGFFAFFAECWRILKVGGTIRVEVPWPLSMETWSDPTHTRAVTPQTVTYLTNPQTVTEDYPVPLRFEISGGPLFHFDPSIEQQAAKAPERWIERAHKEWGIVHFWSFELRKVTL